MTFSPGLDPLPLFPLYWLPRVYYPRERSPDYRYHSCVRDLLHRDPVSAIPGS